MIYLDNSATTLPDESVLKSFKEVSETFFANPSSIHHLGGEAESLLENARKQVAELLHVGQNEVIYTSGGTEGNNLAIKGIALEHQNRGKHIITSMIEHPSVYEACRSLEHLGFDITYLPVNQQGVVSVEELEQSIRDDTILISIMHVNNELGTIQPIEEIGLLAKKYPKLYFHVDAVQSIGKVPLTLSESGIDLCTMSGHKFHGLKGTGILYVNERTTLYPLFHGGFQEKQIRSGTENLAGIVSISKALRIIKENEKKNQQNLYDLQQYLRSQLEGLTGVYINTPDSHVAPHILNLSIPGIKSEVAVHMLSEENILISTRSACSSKSQKEDRILTSCGYSSKRSESALRVSMSIQNTAEEILMFSQALKKVINELNKIME